MAGLRQIFKNDRKDARSRSVPERMPDLTVSQFGNVWECLGVFGSVWECLGISRAAVVRFAEKTGGVAAQLHPNEPTWQQPDSDIASFLMKYLLPTDVPSLLFSWNQACLAFFGQNVSTKVDVYNSHSPF